MNVDNILWDKVFFILASSLKTEKFACLMCMTAALMAAYKGERDREIDSFHRQAANLKTLDLLYLSHVHADHLNGVEKLLESKRVGDPT